MIEEVTRVYSIEMGRDEIDVDVRISSEYLKEAKNFGHSQIKIYPDRYRLLNGHIEYFTNLVKNLTVLRNQLQGEMK